MEVGSLVLARFPVDKEVYRARVEEMIVEADILR